MIEKSNKAVQKAFDLANKISQTLNKLNLYMESGKEPPETLTEELADLETELDSYVKKLLGQRENLKGDLLESKSLNELNADELEWSYEKAVSYTKSQKGKPSRIFFMPFRYEKTDKGLRKDMPDFTENQRLKAFGQFIGEFVAEKAAMFEFEHNEEVEFEVKVRPPIFEWVVLEHEEKNIPIFHQAIVNEKAFDVSNFFEAHKRLSEEGWIESDGGGAQTWFMGVIPFVVLNDREEVLESINFEDTALDFIEQFEEIFLSECPQSSGNWEVPTSPTMIADKGTDMLWKKHVTMALDISETKRPKDGMIRTDLTFKWLDNDFAKVGVSIQTLNKNGESVWARQISRWPLMREHFMDVVEWVGSNERMRSFHAALIVHHEKFDPNELDD